MSLGLTAAAMNRGGQLIMFIDFASLLIVFGGSIGSLMVAYPGGWLKNAFRVARNAFTTQPRDSTAMLNLMREMSNRARREGVLALEEIAQDIDDDFLRRGVQMVVDGHDPEAIEDVLYLEIEKVAERHKEGSDMFSSWGDFAPAFGMIGTLVGLVQMLSNLSDPSSIGPAMAVALLTTFYGALLANSFCIPLSNKLQVRSAEEVAEKTLIAQGLLSILAGESPRFLVDRLNVQLSPSERAQEAS